MLRSGSYITLIRYCASMPSSSRRRCAALQSQNQYNTCAVFPSRDIHRQGLGIEAYPPVLIPRWNASSHLRFQVSNKQISHIILLPLLPSISHQTLIYKNSLTPPPKNLTSQNPPSSTQPHHEPPNLPPIIQHIHIRIRPPPPHNTNGTHRPPPPQPGRGSIPNETPTTKTL